MEVEYTERAFKEIKKIAKADKKSARIIIQKIENFALNPKGNHNVKHLKGEFENLLRLRAGDYRIILVIEYEKITITTIKHRQGIYND